MSIVWTNKNLPIIHHEEIIEWDISSANVSLMRYYKLAPLKEVERLAELPKAKREVAVGMKMKDKVFADSLEKAFTDIINEFLVANHLDQEENCVSIKKDAVFVRNHVIRKSEFGDAVTFVPKNKYTGLIVIPGYEFYYTGRKLDVKGISDDSLRLHKNGIPDFITMVFEDCRKFREMNQDLKDFAKMYKNRDLEFNMYREFNTNSQFKVYMCGAEVYMDDIDEELLKSTDISYNYSKIYIPVLQKALG